MFENIWNYFKKCSSEGDESKVLCVICDAYINYSVISELKQHLIKCHFSHINNNGKVRKKRKPSEFQYRSFLWNHFTKTACAFFAECRYCKRNLSYRTTTCNLKKHLCRAHPEVDLHAKPNEVEKEVSLKNEDNNSRDSQSDSDLDNNAEEPDEQDNTSDTILSFYTIDPNNKARCIICKESFTRHEPFLKQHLADKHPKVRHPTAPNSDSDEDQTNCYTEILYLAEEQPKLPPLKAKPVILNKPVIVKQENETRKRKRSPPKTRYEEEYEVSINNGEPKNASSATDTDDEIENFGRYVIGLLKKLPKDICTQLQMDIINMIMTAKLTTMSKVPPLVPFSLHTSSHANLEDSNNVITISNGEIVSTNTNTDNNINMSVNTSMPSSSQ